jgi:hypothetical protein
MELYGTAVDADAKSRSDFKSKRKGYFIMNLRKQRQRQKKREALNEERLFGNVYNNQDSTARIAINHMMRMSGRNK